MSVYIPKVGDIVQYSHAASGIIRRNGTIMRREDGFFYVAIPGYGIEFPAHDDNRHGQLTPSPMNKGLCDLCV